MCRDFPIWCRVADRWASLHSVAQISLVCFEFLCRDRKLENIVHWEFSFLVELFTLVFLSLSNKLFRFVCFFVFCFNLARKFKIQNFFFGNLIKELLAPLRYRNIFLLSWYPIEKKTNKNRGKEDGDGENVVILITDDQHVFIGADSALSSRLFCRQIFIVKTRRYILKLSLIFFSFLVFALECCCVWPSSQGLIKLHNWREGKNGGELRVGHSTYSAPLWRHRWIVRPNLVTSPNVSVKTNYCHHIQFCFVCVLFAFQLVWNSFWSHQMICGQ